MIKTTAPTPLLYSCLSNFEKSICFLLCFSVLSFLSSCFSQNEKGYTLDGSYEIDLYSNGRPELIFNIEIPLELRKMCEEGLRAGKNHFAKVYITHIDGFVLKSINHGAILSPEKITEYISDGKTPEADSMNKKIFMKGYIAYWENSGLKTIGDILKLKGFCKFDNSSDSIPLNINLVMSATQYLDYETVNSGTISKALKIEVQKSAYKSIRTNDFDIPEGLAEYTGLEALHIKGVLNEPLPTWLYNLKHLKTLILYQALHPSWVMDAVSKPKKYHSFKVPVVLFQIKTLKTLELKGFHLEFPEIPENSVLEEFIFNTNEFLAIPESIIRLRALKTLTIHEFALPLPSGLNELKKLEYLSIYVGKSGLPGGFGPWPELKTMRLYCRPALTPEQLDKLKQEHPNAELIIKVR